MTESRKGGAGGKRKEFSAPALEKGLDIIEALVVPFLAFLDGSHPVKIDAAQRAIARTAEQSTAGLGH